MEARITSKGQVTLPKDLRDMLRLQAGDKLSFSLTKEGYIQAIPTKQKVTALKGFFGQVEKSCSLEDMEEAIARGACASDCR